MGRSQLAIEEIMAVAKHIRLARAAFDQAREIYPDRSIKLRHGARLIIESRWFLLQMALRFT